jgi:hypothetical protein
MSDVEVNPIEDLIQAAFNQDYNKANEVFGDLMGAKVTDALDQEKIGIANQLYNTAEPEEVDDEVDDEELDLDISDEDLEVDEDEDI